MKTGHWPKNGTVGTSPGRVRDMSRTSATKPIYSQYSELFNLVCPSIRVYPKHYLISYYITLVWVLLTFVCYIIQSATLPPVSRVMWTSYSYHYIHILITDSLKTQLIIIKWHHHEKLHVHKQYESISNKYLADVLHLLGTSCSCYNNNCIPKLWYNALTFSIHKFYRIVLILFSSLLTQIHYSKIIWSFQTSWVE